MEKEMTGTLAQRWFAAQGIESEISDGLADAGFDDFDGIGGDWYDNSIEINGAPADARMSQAAQDWLLKHCGFSKIYLNHKDGWETHYGLSNGPYGWRRRYVSDPTATTTNVIAGDPNPGYFEISYWPESWAKRRDWLETGYMRIVPDPLVPV